MNAAICTLFEGHFHYGLGALANSLHAAGFRGTLWAGYRGKLPPWAQGPRHEVTAGFDIRFLPLETDRHLTNYKPEFMLELWEKQAREAEALFYLDPDMVLKCGWDFFEEWVRGGVALCEDINSPVNPTHPLRAQWQRHFVPHGIALDSQRPEYVNGGFIGVPLAHRVFLEEWKRVQAIVADSTDGMKGMNLGSRTFLFQKTDQDALNIAFLSTAAPVSVIGREGMDFARGGYTLSHATGSPKPWRKRMLLSALQGRGPRSADRAFWKHVEHPIRLYPAPRVRLARLDLALGAAVGRIIRRA